MVNRSVRGVCFSEVQLAASTQRPLPSSAAATRHERVDYSHVISLKHVRDNLNLKILRQGQVRALLLDCRLRLLMLGLCACFCVQLAAVLCVAVFKVQFRDDERVDYSHVMSLNMCGTI